MTICRPTTDASDQYRPSSSSASGELKETALPGNLADYMKNGPVILVSECDHNDALPTASSEPKI